MRRLTDNLAGDAIDQNSLLWIASCMAWHVERRGQEGEQTVFLCVKQSEERRISARGACQCLPKQDFGGTDGKGWEMTSPRP